MTLLFVRYRFFFFWFLFSFSLFGKQKVTKLCMPVTIFLHSSRPLYIIHIIMYLRAAVYIYIFNATAIVCRVSRKNKTKRIFKKIPRPSTVIHSKTSKRDYHHPRPTTTAAAPSPSPPPRNHNNYYYT